MSDNDWARPRRGRVPVFRARNVEGNKRFPYLWITKIIIIDQWVGVRRRFQQIWVKLLGLPRMQHREMQRVRQDIRPLRNYWLQNIVIQAEPEAFSRFQPTRKS